MRYGEFVFYNTDVLSVEEKTAVLRECKDACYKWRANKLDCSESLSRTTINCTFEEILEHLSEEAHVVIINRGLWDSPAGENREHFEIGFSSIESPAEHFLFINVYSDKMPPILAKYNLMPIAS